MNVQNVATNGAAGKTKPPFHIPTMKEIESIPKNGLTVVSTFSGAGGSCLGYRMAGFRVLWASEFIPAAAEIYTANHPDTPLDTRDIREVQADEILQSISKKTGELDLLDGSPPCAAFSDSGRRHKGWNMVKKYSQTHQRIDDLFFEYARLLKGLMPKVFIAENVAGLVKGKCKGYFLEILDALKTCGYRVVAKLLDAQWLGVPQTRSRLIFQGIRNDLCVDPVFPRPMPYRYSFREATDGLKKEPRHLLVGNTLKHWENTPPGHFFAKVTGQSFFNHFRLNHHLPCPCVTTRRCLHHPDIPAYLSIAEIKRCATFPDDFQLVGSPTQQWERIGRAVPPLMMKAIAEVIRDEILGSGCPSRKMDV